VSYFVSTAKVSVFVLVDIFRMEPKSEYQYHSKELYNLFIQEKSGKGECIYQNQMRIIPYTMDL
jgi:hypothetical protein